MKTKPNSTVSSRIQTALSSIVFGVKKDADKLIEAELRSLKNSGVITEYIISTHMRREEYYGSIFYKTEPQSVFINIDFSVHSS